MTAVPKLLMDLKAFGIWSVMTLLPILTRLFATLSDVPINLPIISLAGSLAFSATKVKPLAIWLIPKSLTPLTVLVKPDQPVDKILPAVSMKEVALSLPSSSNSPALSLAISMASPALAFNLPACPAKPPNMFEKSTEIFVCLRSSSTMKPVFWCRSFR